MIIERSLVMQIGLPIGLTRRVSPLWQNVYVRSLKLLFRILLR